MKDHFFSARHRIGDDAGAPDFRARARRGRHRDDRQDSRHIGTPPPVVDVLEVPHRSTLARHKRDHLAGIEGGAAAEGDDAVMLALTQRLETGFDVGCDRIGLNIAEQGGRHAIAGQHLHGPRAHPQAREPSVGDQQRPRHAGSLDGGAELADAAGAEAHAGGIVPVAYEFHDISRILLLGI